MPTAEMSFGASIGPVDARPTPTVRYPSWMDPAYVLAASRVDPSEVIALSAGVVRVIGGNPRRFGIGFIARSSNTAAVLIAMTNAPATDPFITLLAGESVFLPLAQFGAAVCYEWYAVCSAAGALRVYTLEQF